MKYVRLSTLSDTKVLAPKLRPDDLREIKAASGLTAEAALCFGVQLSNPCLSFVDPHGELAGMFGVTPTYASEVGAVWLLSSDAIEKYPIHFLRRCKEWVEEFHRSYPVLMNFVDQRNTVHINWLRWMGFSFVGLHPYGVEQLPFYEIVRVKNYV